MIYHISNSSAHDVCVISEKKKKKLELSPSHGILVVKWFWN